MEHAGREAYKWCPIILSADPYICIASPGGLQNRVSTLDRCREERFASPHLAYSFAHHIKLNVHRRVVWLACLSLIKYSASSLDQPVKCRLHPAPFTREVHCPLSLWHLHNAATAVALNSPCLARSSGAVASWTFIPHPTRPFPRPTSHEQSPSNPRAFFLGLMPTSPQTSDIHWRVRKHVCDRHPSTPAFVAWPNSALSHSQPPRVSRIAPELRSSVYPFVLFVCPMTKTLTVIRPSTTPTPSDEAFLTAAPLNTAQTKTRTRQSLPFYRAHWNLPQTR
jgi:hypothetical protein